MNIIKKLLPFLRTRKDIAARSNERRQVLYRHIHLAPRINDDYTTDTFICINGVRVAKVVKNDQDEGNEPKVYTDEVESMMTYLRRQYYKLHKKDIIV